MATYLTAGEVACSEDGSSVAIKAFFPERGFKFTKSNGVRDIFSSHPKDPRRGRAACRDRGCFRGRNAADWVAM